MTRDRQRTQKDRERRQYFRIEDSVRFDYKLISPAELERRLKQDRDTEMADEFTAISSLQAIGQEMTGVLRKIETEAPDIARYLKAMDRKIELLARSLLNKDENLLDQPAKAVNLSASGISFDAAEPLDVGSLLEIRLLLLPDYVGMVIYGEVVGCETAVAENQQQAFCTRVNFTHLREEDRDVLIRHVLQRQSEYLRRRRDQMPVPKPR